MKVDRVIYSPGPGETRHAVFKYYISKINITLWWWLHPPRSHSLPSTTSTNRAVYRLSTNLNLRLNIVHDDICPWNLLIDAETENIRLFDFNSAAKLGQEGDRANSAEFQYDADRNDVKYVVFAVYELITREFSFRCEFYPDELDATKVMEQKTWTQHRHSNLDSPVDEYRRLLAEGVKARAKTDKAVNYFTKASQPLKWPPLRVDDPFMDSDWSPLKRMGRMRSVMVELKRDFLRWERPPTRAFPLPSNQHLLATRQVVRSRNVATASAASPAATRTGTSAGASAAASAAAFAAATTRKGVVPGGTGAGAGTGAASKNPPL